jgi:hypothetical protein
MSSEKDPPLHLFPYLGSEQCFFLSSMGYNARSLPGG